MGTPSGEERTLRVGDLQYWVDENYLSQCFAHTGDVLSVKIIRNKITGQPEGYGFVEFVSHAAAERVLHTYNGTLMPGTEQPFRLNWASSREREEEGGGWGSTFLKVASAAAAVATVAGGLYALLKQPEHEPGGGVQRQNKEKEVLKVWTKPKMGWIKLNVDGSLQSGSAGCGGVLRDSSGKWISGFAVKLAQSSGGHYPDKPEKEALCRGLQWARGRRVRKVVVESDNRGIVDVVNSGSRTTNPLILQIRNLLSCGDWEATLNWIPGDANRVADKLADIARDWPSFELREFDSPPDGCRSLMADGH